MLESECKNRRCIMLRCCGSVWLPPIIASAHSLVLVETDTALLFFTWKDACHVYLLYLALCSLSQAVYIKRMATVNRMRVPTAFRPGVNLQRPWVHNRLVQAASNRAPYVLYRKSPQRYAVKHFAPSSTRNMFAGGPWKTTVRLPISPVTPEYEFVKAASSAPVVHTDGGTG
uniref:SFRICE_030968 n=1 Tax=Spodoptera frugiperda TaxID=7108 RepID=A0A2H1W3A6_SPOFR